MARRFAPSDLLCNPSVVGYILPEESCLILCFHLMHGALKLQKHHGICIHGLGNDQSWVSGLALGLMDL